jgi:hypothetical protein
VVAQGKSDLLEVIGARHVCSGLPHLLDGGQQPDQDGDDRDYHQ